MSACVIVFKMYKGDMLVGILVGEQGSKIKVEHPFLVRILTNGQLAMSPYCPLSDETYFEFRSADLEYVVLANTDITDRFISMVSEIGEVKMSATIDTIEEEISSRTFIPGNNTKH